ncbi:MAG: MotA/TolQ/Exb proton channel, partial [Proteobacteria bacterium]|nr:MotA/TolQ/Exb proton channel [Pseudomonadota bacterium]
MIKHSFLIAFILVSLTGFSVFAQSDMRQDYKILEQQQQQLMDKALDEKKQAKKEAQEQQLLIKNDKKALQDAIAKLKTQIAALKDGNKQIQTRVRDLKTQTQKLNQELEKTSAVNREFEGVVRINAKDLKALLIQSIQSGITPDRQTFLKPLILQENFPSMDDITLLSDLLFEEMHASGQVKVTKGMIVDRQGREQEANLLVLGNFTGIYMLDKEVGFLLYSDQSQR